MSSKRKETQPTLPEETPEVVEVVEETDPIASLVAERTIAVGQCLERYPSLKAGYVTRKGVWFDETLAAKSLEAGEEMITVTSKKEKQ